MRHSVACAGQRQRVVAGLLFTATLPLHAAQKAARPAGHPPGAAIASAHALATDAGLEMIRAGGNAFDAAVAVSATLAVVEPISSGIGGGGFFLLHDAQERQGCVRRRARDRAGRGDARGVPRREGRAQSRSRHQRPVVGRHPRPAGGTGARVEEIRSPAAEDHAGAGDPHRARRLRGVSAPGARLRQPSRSDGALSRHARGVPGRRHAAQGRRDPQAARPGAHAGTARRRRASTVSIAAKSPTSCWPR